MTNDQIKKLIREVLAEGVDFHFPDEDIASVVRSELAPIENRLAALEKSKSPTAREPRDLTPAPHTKPPRIDTVAAAKKGAKR